MNDLLQFFSWSHLPPKMQEISQRFGRLALELDEILPNNCQKDALFQKLIEAKDCAVRAQIFKAGDNTNDQG